MAVIGQFGAAVAEADPNPEPDTFVFYGDTFTVREQVSALPLMKYAHAAVQNSSNEAYELAAIYEFIRSTVLPEEWDRFERVAIDNAADEAVLIQVTRAIYMAVTSRPTKRPSDSSAGPQPTTNGSNPGSSSPATGPASAVWPKSPVRPDLAVEMLSVDELAAV